MLQDSFARISSLERNAAECDVADDLDWGLLMHAKERELAVQFAEFATVMRKAVADYDTCCLAGYLVELARAFNSFYHDCPVVKGVLGKGLSALTIRPLDHM